MKQFIGASKLLTLGFKEENIGTFVKHGKNGKKLVTIILDARGYLVRSIGMRKNGDGSIPLYWRG